MENSFHPVDLKPDFHNRFIIDLKILYFLVYSFDFFYFSIFIIFREYCHRFAIDQKAICFHCNHNTSHGASIVRLKFVWTIEIFFQNILSMKIVQKKKWKEKRR